MPQESQASKRLEELKHQALKAGPFSLEELTALSHLFKEPSFQLLLRYLELAEAHLQTEVWRSEDWEHFTMLKGEKRSLDKLKRLPEEINQMREAKMEERSDT